ncbi:hypothetical protein FA15DRAFT_676140 [Coprinopsis marcescibilis]|uniref:Uncharacterized protein n=1 Tax=Coprinopsis marcescibilis TaxID=230819 RepID=A0A5C3KBV6_COPMA|nr:hypothetical protein FA15DRAFT_676140 [Coprinopsis marcescibilis]
MERLLQMTYPGQFHQLPDIAHRQTRGMKLFPALFYVVCLVLLSFRLSQFEGVRYSAIVLYLLNHYEGLVNTVRSSSLDGTLSRALSALSDMAAPLAVHYNWNY